MKTITLKIDAALHQELERQARRLGLSKSAVTRNALKESFRKKRAPSCHDLMAAACGSLKNAPSDLATNKKYLKGFGDWKG
ncbi:MAG TPA: hypothetical protein VFB72_17880 [Verrucomicrobiae bacterium]|nr:hypothetical protein [Verrucomicrobiae bacterium]